MFTLRAAVILVRQTTRVMRTLHHSTLHVQTDDKSKEELDFFMKMQLSNQ